MEAWQERVVEEHAALEIRISALSAFLNNPNAPKVSIMEALRLRDQFCMMKGYIDILSQRIEAFTL